MVESDPPLAHRRSCGVGIPSKDGAMEATVDDWDEGNFPKVVTLVAKHERTALRVGGSSSLSQLESVSQSSGSSSPKPSSVSVE